MFNRAAGDPVSGLYPNDMEEFLKTDLIKLEEKLSDFASHHQRKAFNAAHGIVKETIAMRRISPRSADMKDFDNGYDKAIKDCLEILIGLTVPETK